MSGQSGAGCGIVIYRWTDATRRPTVAARTALRAALDGLGICRESCEDAELALSELVANAAEHARGSYEVRLHRTDVAWICEVHDRDPKIPPVTELQTEAPFDPAEERRGGGLDALLSVLAERGRGLRIVHELTGGAWGFRRDADGFGKRAWYMIAALPGPVPLHDTAAAQEPSV